MDWWRSKMTIGELLFNLVCLAVGAYVGMVVFVASGGCGF